MAKQFHICRWQKVFHTFAVSTYNKEMTSDCPFGWQLKIWKMLISLQILLEISNKQLYFCEVKNNAKLQNIPIRYSHQMFLKFHRWRSCQNAALCSVLCSGVVVLYLGELRNLSFSSFCTVCTNYGTLVVVLFAQILSHEYPKSVIWHH